MDVKNKESSAKSQITWGTTFWPGRFLQAPWPYCHVHWGSYKLERVEIVSIGRVFETLHKTLEPAGMNKTREVFRVTG